MNTNAVRTKVNGYGLYHLVVAFLLGMAVALSLIISLALTAPAHASTTALEAGDAAGSLAPEDLRITYAERVPGVRGASLYFELNDGTAWRATRCRFEDSRNCWWDAGRRGDRTGTSVVKVGGERRGFTLNVPGRWLR